MQKSITIQPAITAAIFGSMPTDLTRTVGAYAMICVALVSAPYRILWATSAYDVDAAELVHGRA